MTISIKLTIEIESADDDAQTNPASWLAGRVRAAVLTHGPRRDA